MYKDEYAEQEKAFFCNNIFGLSWYVDSYNETMGRFVTPVLLGCNKDWK